MPFSLVTLTRNAWVQWISALVLLMATDYLLTSVWSDAPTWLNYVVYWVLLTALFVGLTELCWRHRAFDEMNLLTRLFVVGGILGLVLAIYRVALHWQLWTVFNILAEPLRTGLYAMAVGWVVSNVQSDTVVTK